MTKAEVGSSCHRCQKFQLCLMACDERGSKEKEFMVMKDIKDPLKDHVAHLNLSPDVRILILCLHVYLFGLVTKMNSEGVK